MDNYELVSIANKLASDTPTKYMLGGWGNQKDGYYLFDCVCLIKSILWGFDFKKGAHGGAIYGSNGVPDVGANKMIELCEDISYDFKNISVGEILWLDGHVGIYVGDRRVVEATVAWDSKVLFSYVLEDGVRIKDNHRVYKWIKHGKLPYIKYNNAYATIVSINIYDISYNSVKISYEVDTPISEVMYSLDNTNYLPFNSIIDNLLPNQKYILTLRVKRAYTDNYTYKKIEFETLKYKYKINDNVIITGPIYADSSSNEIISYANNSIGIITKIEHNLHPYMIDNIGYTNEEYIEPYKMDKYNNVLVILKKYLILLISVVLLIYSIIKSIL